MAIDNVAGKASAIGSSVFNVLFWIILLLAAGGLVYLILKILKYKHTVIIREVVKGRKIIFSDKAREFEDDDGVLWWKLLRAKKLIPAPQPEAIEINSRGKKFVEAYRTETGEYQFLSDQEKIPDSFKPFTTQQRLIMTSQIRKAEEKRRKNWTEHLPAIAAIGGVVVIVVCLMIFYADMAEPLLQMGKTVNHNQELRNQELKIIQEMERDIQIIKSELEIEEKKPPN